MENQYGRVLLSCAPGKVKLTAALILVIGSLVIATVQFDRTRFSIDNNNNTPKDDSENKEEVYPSQECSAERFPARHWARPSSKYYNRTAHQEGGKQMYGTVAAQQAVWRHQHPLRCHNKKFLVYEALGRDHGIGSVVHVLSIALHAALNMDRILVLAPQPQFEWVQGRFCDAMLTLDECYFEPLSSCTILDADRVRVRVFYVLEETTTLNALNGHDFNLSITPLQGEGVAFHSCESSNGAALHLVSAIVGQSCTVKNDNEQDSPE